MPARTADLGIADERLGPLMRDPERAAIFCDIDGTLAPIVRHAEDARVPERTSRLLGVIGRRYGCVACISGRSATEARRLVGVGSIAYAGIHGAELLDVGDRKATLAPGVEDWTERVRRFADGAMDGIRLLRIRVEHKGPIVAFHWRGAPDEAAARTRLDEVAGEAMGAGLTPHWGRKVLEVRPPFELSKGRPIRELVSRTGVTAALFGGDDTTDLDAFDALDELRSEGAIEIGVKVGVRSEEAPDAIVERADLVVDGVAGFAEVLEALAA